MRLGRMGGVTLPVALSLVFLRQLQEFRDPFASWTEDAQLLALGTNWGTTWIFGFCRFAAGHGDLPVAEVD